MSDSGTPGAAFSMYFRKFLREEIVTEINRKVLIDGYDKEYLCSYVYDILAIYLPQYPEPEENPGDMKQFLEYCSTVFSKKYLATIRARLDRFIKEISEGPDMPDSFISEASFYRWIMSLLKAISEKCLATTTSHKLNILSSLRRSAIEQVTLRGPTPKQAWMDSSAEFGFRMPMGWTPS